MYREEARHIMEMETSGQRVATQSRRQAILDAALTCFASKGFTETTMEDIRKLSGASTGSIYHHFANKEMLARALYLDGWASLYAALSAAFVGASLRERIEALVNAYLDWFVQHAELEHYLLQAVESEYLSSYVNELQQKTVANLPSENPCDQIAHWLAPYISDGTVARLPQALYMPLLLGPSREFVRVWLWKRDAVEMQEAREPLAHAAWVVLTARGE